MAKKNVNVEALENDLQLNDLKGGVSKSKYDLDFVNENNPLEVIQSHIGDSTMVGAKFDSERESKVQEGIDLIKSIKIGDKNIPETFILISKWWEFKPVRNELKRMLDEEAIQLGMESHEYIQNYIGEMIDGMKELQQGINRLAYVRTFFKPRGEVKSKDKPRIISIDGVQYEIGENKLAMLKNKYPNKSDISKLREEIISIAIRKDIEEL